MSFTQAVCRWRMREIANMQFFAHEQIHFRPYAHLIRVKRWVLQTKFRRVWRSKKMQKWEALKVLHLFFYCDTRFNVFLLWHAIQVIVLFRAMSKWPKTSEQLHQIAKIWGEATKRFLRFLRFAHVLGCECVWACTRIYLHMLRHAKIACVKYQKKEQINDFLTLKRAAHHTF